MRDKLIAAGVKNLKEFGYPDVNNESILTNNIYARFFLKMLEELEENSDEPVVNALIVEIKANLAVR
jgi:hypothetical protein